MKKLAALTLSLFLTSGIAFADSPKDSDAAATKKTSSEKAKETPSSDKSNSAIAAEIEELRQTLQSQQEQLQLLKEELAKRDRQIDEAREAAAAANSRATEASVKAGEAVATSSAARSASATSNTVVASKAGDPIVAQQGPEPQAKPAEEGPSTIRYKGVSLTPQGQRYAADVRKALTLLGGGRRRRQHQRQVPDGTACRRDPCRGLSARRLYDRRRPGRPRAGRDGRAMRHHRRAGYDPVSVGRHGCRAAYLKLAFPQQAWCSVTRLKQ